MPRDLTGCKFGRWYVVGKAPPKLRKNGKQRSMWAVKCDCGKERIVAPSDLTLGKSQSCGCLKREMTSARHTTHGATRGHKKSPEYRAWLGMLSRCRYPHHFKDHAGRGITVCGAWRDFTVFRNDMGNRPSSRHSIDRIDNSKGYSPQNCRWATRREQNRNKRNNRLLTHDGKTMCLQTWSETLGIHRATLADRLRRGWPVDRALTTKPIHRGGSK